MAVLSGKQISEFIHQGKLTIEPFTPEQTQPASYDLKIGNKILASPVGPQKLGRVAILSRDKPIFSILSGQMVGVISQEKILMPNDLCGRFGIRSSFARLGIMPFGGLQLDPGFRGRLIMNLLNVGPEPVDVKLDDILFTVEFERLDEPSEISYSGPYQDQDDFPEDQYNYIMSAHTTSLAEIPTLRMEITRLSNVIEELEDSLPDPDENLIIKPEIVEKLKHVVRSPDSAFISIDEIKTRLKAD